MSTPEPSSFLFALIIKFCKPVLEAKRQREQEVAASWTRFQGVRMLALTLSARYTMLFLYANSQSACSKKPRQMSEQTLFISYKPQLIGVQPGQTLDVKEMNEN
eukprot:1137844-Pelagomonas_calceolata.AAC.5